MAFLCFVCLGFFPLNVIYTVYLYVQYVLSKYYRLCKGRIFKEADLGTFAGVEKIAR